MKLTPKEAQRLYDAGVQEAAREEYDQAIASFERSYQVTRGPLALFNIAQCHRKAGRPGPAVDYFERFLREALPGEEYRPKAEAYLLESREKATEERAAKLFSEKQYAEAAAAYEAAYKLRPAPQQLLQAASAYRLADRLAEAIAVYERALRTGLSPGQKDEAEKSLAELRARQEDRQAKALAGRQLFVEAARSWVAAYRYQANSDYLYSAGHAQKRAGQHAEALRTFERYLDEDPQTPRRSEVEETQRELRALIKDQRAQQLLGKGSMDEAVAVWEDAYRTKPLPLFLFQQGRTLRMRQHHREALARFEQYLLEDKEPPLGRKLEATAAVAELRGVLAARREAEDARRSLERPPVHRRPWFVGLMIGLSAAVGAGVATGLALGLPRPPQADLGTAAVTFP